MIASATAVTDHATTSGVAARTASHIDATSIVPCAHQRSGTVRRSA